MSRVAANKASSGETPLQSFSDSVSSVDSGVGVTPASDFVSSEVGSAVGDCANPLMTLAKIATITRVGLLRGAKITEGKINVILKKSPLLAKPNLRDSTSHMR